MTSSFRDMRGAPLDRAKRGGTTVKGTTTGSNGPSPTVRGNAAKSQLVQRFPSSPSPLRMNAPSSARRRGSRATGAPSSRASARAGSPGGGSSGGGVARCNGIDRERGKHAFTQTRPVVAATEAAPDGAGALGSKTDGGRGPPAGLPILHDQSASSSSSSSSSEDEGFADGVPLSLVPVRARPSFAAHAVLEAAATAAANPAVRAPPKDSSPELPRQVAGRVSIPHAAPVSRLSPALILSDPVPSATQVMIVEPSTGPQPLPFRAPGSQKQPQATPTVRARTKSLPLSASTRAKALKKLREEELRCYFRDPRLEAILSLIRSGQPFCEERHIVVDFVRRAKPSLTGRADMQAADDALRHAVLLTDAALYLLEIEMLPNTHHVQQAHDSDSADPKRVTPPPPRVNDPDPLADAGSSGPADGDCGRGGGNVGVTLSSISEVAQEGSDIGTAAATVAADQPRGDVRPQGVGAGAGAGARAGAAAAAGGRLTRVAGDKPKIKSIKMMDRLQPPELTRVSLPFKEITLRSGDVVARRGCGVVLHTRVGGRRDHVWLKCRSNQDRGAFIDALVPWFEAHSPQGVELCVQQVPESPLAARLARLEAAEQGANSDVRPKDTDCVIS